MRVRPNLKLCKRMKSSCIYYTSNRLPRLLFSIYKTNSHHMFYGLGFQLSTEAIMDGSRVAQSLDSLWFYSNILTCRYQPLASLTDQFSPSIHPKRDLQKPNIPLFLLNQPHESHQNVENMTPRCHKCGASSSALEEVRVSEMVRRSRRDTEKRGRRKRREWNRHGLNGTEVILGGLDLGFDVKEVSGFLKFEEEESCNKYQMLATQQQAKMPPFDDDVAMKQHLKSRAYAVACTVK